MGNVSCGCESSGDRKADDHGERPVIRRDDRSVAKRANQTRDFDDCVPFLVRDGAAQKSLAKLDDTEAPGSPPGPGAKDASEVSKVATEAQSVKIFATAIDAAVSGLQLEAADAADEEPLVAEISEKKISVPVQVVQKGWNKFRFDSDWASMSFDSVKRQYYSLVSEKLYEDQSQTPAALRYTWDPTDPARCLGVEMQLTAKKPKKEHDYYKEMKLYFHGCVEPGLCTGALPVASVGPLTMCLKQDPNIHCVAWEVPTCDDAEQVNLKLSSEDITIQVTPFCKQKCKVWYLEATDKLLQQLALVSSQKNAGPVALFREVMPTHIKSNCPKVPSFKQVLNRAGNIDIEEIPAEPKKSQKKAVATEKTRGSTSHFELMRDLTY